MANYKTQICTVSLNTSDNFATAADAAITPPAGYTTIEKIANIEFVPPSMNAAGTIKTSKFIFTIIWHD